MVWHFFKKDVRLLWPLALAVVVVQVLCALRTCVLGYFDQPLILDKLTFFLPLLVYLGIVIVSVTVVHQEPLSGGQDDWLIRPIRRRDLALSKVLFVLLMVNMPLMFVDLVQQLALHFPVSVSIGVALFRFLVMVFAVSLPALVLGAVTRSLIDAFVFGIGSAIVVIFLSVFEIPALSLASSGVGGQPGMGWISVEAAGLVMSLGAAAVLVFQYVTRRTLVARGIALAAVLAAVCTLICLPRTAAIAVQEAVWGNFGTSEVKLGFDSALQVAHADWDSGPGRGYGSAVPAATGFSGPADMAHLGKQIESIRLPLSIYGLHPGNILFADRVAVRITSTTGRMLYQGAGVCAPSIGGPTGGAVCLDNGLEIRSGATEGSKIASEQQLNLPIAVYNRIKDVPVRVEVTYVLTQFAAQPSRAIGAVGDRQSMPEMGTCATRIDDDGDEIEFNCLSNVGIPSCATVVLEDPQTHQRNPELKMCRPSYGPFHRDGTEDAVGHSHLSIPFRDPSGLARYPVDGAAMERARVVVTAYDPVAHFRSTVAIPSIRLVEWRLPNG